MYIFCNIKLVNKNKMYQENQLENIYRNPTYRMEHKQLQQIKYCICE